MPLNPPPRDLENNTTPHDHDGITSTDGVIRRISEQQIITKAGKRRISSIAFKSSSKPGEGMSVDLEALIIESGHDPKIYVTTPRWIGSVYFTAGQLRSYGLSVGFDPTDANPFHGQVWGNFSKETQLSLQNNTEWYVEIKGVSIRT